MKHSLSRPSVDESARYRLTCLGSASIGGPRHLKPCALAASEEPGDVEAEAVERASRALVGIGWREWGWECLTCRAARETLGGILDHVAAHLGR